MKGGGYASELLQEEMGLTHRIPGRYKSEFPQLQGGSTETVKVGSRITGSGIRQRNAILDKKFDKRRLREESTVGNHRVRKWHILRSY
jgi:hypothetical protein